MPDIRRTLEYHGAEHKSISAMKAATSHCRNAKHTCFHRAAVPPFDFHAAYKRAALFSACFHMDNMVLRMATKLLFLAPFVALGYEFIRYAGRHNNLLVRTCPNPIWMQRLTTREPDEEQLEVAIAALKPALPRSSRL